MADAQKDGIWDDGLSTLKAIEKSCLMKQFGAEEGLKLFEELNSEDFEMPDNIDKIDLDALDAELAEYDPDAEDEEDEDVE